MADNSQKFIARNRAPRVQIEYDVELYGSEKKVQLPFVMGVMSDLTGKSKVEQPAVADRKFLEIDVDNFDERMRGMAPRAAFTVPNTLTGDGNLAIDLTFEKMSDFSPGAIASKVDALKPLLEARSQLSNLMAYMDGKSGAETLIEKILGDRALLSALSSEGADAGASMASALDSLRGVELPSAEADQSGDILAGLRAKAPTDQPKEDASAAALASLAAVEIAETPKDDSAGVLDALAAQEVAEITDSGTADALESLAAVEIDETPEDDGSDVLADLAAMDVEEEVDTAASDALESLAAVEIDEMPEDDGADVLSDLAAMEIEEEIDTAASDALESLAAVEIDETPEDDGADVLSDLAAMEIEDEVDTAASDALESLAAVEIDETPEDDGADVLGDLAALEVEEEVDTAASDALESLVAVEIDEMPEDDGADVLGDLAELEVEEEVDTAASDALESLAAVEIDEMPEDDGADVLSDLAALEVEEEVDTAASDALESLAAVEIDEMPEDDGSDVLGDLAAMEVDDEAETAATEALESLAAIEVEDAVEDDGDDVLGDLAAQEPDDDSLDDGDDDLSALLDDLDAGNEEPQEDPLDSVLDGLEEPEVAPEEDVDGILDGLGDDDADPLAALAAEDEPALDVDGDGLDDLLADLDGGDDEALVETPDLAADDDTDVADVDLDDLLGDLTEDGEDDGDDLDGLLSGLEDDAADEDAPEGGDDLDDLLGDLGGDDSELDALLGDDEPGGDDDLDLDDLLGGLDDGADGDEPDLDLDDLLGDLGGDDDTAATAAPDGVTPTEDPEFAYGTMSADRPEPQKLVRKRFRLAILGDFSGRSAKGLIETGDDLAARKAVILDPDTIEDVIESFATELLLPIGKDGAAMSVKLDELDALHPDELYENVELFSELVGLRKQLQSGVTADHAAKTLRAWGETHGTRVKPPKMRSGGNAIPADRRLSAFQQLIGDSENQLGEASPVQDLLARVVGPHIRALPDADVTAMMGAVDAALSDAMRMVLHHPEFQSLEAQWRTLDLIARSVEVDDTLEVMLYDISAEELAADLASVDDLTESGFVKLLTGEPLDEENGRGGYSALIGLYQFEETPPHAELLGRIARVAAHVDAPFFAAMSPAFLETEKAKLPGVVSQAWDTLRGMAEAGHLGLVSPRFMLRRPYGAKSEPIYEFEFEEFTEAEGLRGMLWANPVVLVAILLARSFKKNGASMGLGQIMSLGDIPFHYVNDRFGDQVALPCTERNINLDKIAMAQERGFMAVSAVKGRDEIRLTSFASLAGGEILGPWTGQPAPKPSPPDPKPAAAAPADDDSGDDLDDLGLDDLGLDDLDLGGDDDGDSDLDDLLAGFGDDDEGDDDDGMDAELAALLGDL